MPVFGCALRGFRIASFEPGPHTFIVSMGETLGKIVSLFVEPGKKCADSLLVRVGHCIKMARSTPTSKRGRVNQLGATMSLFERTAALSR